MTRRVLSLWQPWATLCIARDLETFKVPKQIETRAFPPRTFGSIPIQMPFEVVIHATKGFNWEQRKICADQAFKNALIGCGYYPGSPKTKNQQHSELRPMPLGQIIGVATVSECVFADDPGLLFAISEEEKTFGLYRADRYAWILTKQRELGTPILFKGRQSVLYELPAEVDREVDRQLGLTLATSPAVAQNSHD